VPVLLLQLFSDLVDCVRDTQSVCQVSPPPFLSNQDVFSRLMEIARRLVQNRLLIFSLLSVRTLRLVLPLHRGQTCPFPDPTSLGNLSHPTGRTMRLLQVVELAPDMRPARDFLNAPILFIELVESGIGICLQRSPKRAQMLFGMFALAIG
jgi:hypothetical protein